MLWSSPTLFGSLCVCLISRRYDLIYINHCGRLFSVFHSVRLRLPNGLCFQSLSISARFAIFVLMIKNFFVVALGGAFGAVLRYGIVLLGAAFGASGQVATFFINILGSFILGFLTSAFAPGSLMLFATVGVCGAFTTFSTYSVHSVSLLQEGRYWTAAFYIIGTVILCLVFAWLGFLAGQRLSSRI